MNYVVITCLLALTASTKAGDLGVSSLVYAPRHSSADYYAYPSYAFEYTVKDPYTGDDKAQWERRDGDTVKGSYSLVEPGGSIRVVEYQADDNSGFNAVVRRIGPKLHPATITAAPIYKAPVPVLSARPVAPITAGPVANLGGLTSAPLITGSVLGGVVSSSNLLKLSQASLVTPTILPAPVLSSPIFKSAPILTAPAPILSIPTPVLPTPIIKSAPVLTAPASLLSNPYIKSASILSAPLSGSILSAPLPLLKGPLGLPLDTLGNSLIRSPLTTSLALDSLDANLLSRGPLLSTYNTL